MSIFIKKNKIVAVQQGRSMIEMLGVLAIIGVLSVGGIAGYSKAMERYRVNETINQISYIVQNTRNLFRTQPNLYGGLSSDGTQFPKSANRAIVEKAKIFPASLVKNDYKNLFGGNIAYRKGGRYSYYDGKAFVLVFYQIPQEACIELATRDWQSGLGLVAMRVVGSSTSGDYTIQNCFTDNCQTQYKQGDSLTYGRDMPVSIEHAVTACDNEKDNQIGWKFY